MNSEQTYLKWYLGAMTVLWECCLKSKEKKKTKQTLQFINNRIENKIESIFMSQCKSNYCLKLKKRVTINLKRLIGGW